jgi:hypothetical protein
MLRKLLWFPSFPVIACGHQVAWTRTWTSESTRCGKKERTRDDHGNGSIVATVLFSYTVLYASGIKHSCVEREARAMDGSTSHTLLSVPQKADLFSSPSCRCDVIGSHQQNADVIGSHRQKIQ